MPALPLGDAGPYVAAAYLVFFGLVLVYVAIMAAKLARIERELGELTELVARRDAQRTAEDSPVAVEEMPRA
jgi:CcmD family protein